MGKSGRRVIRVLDALDAGAATVGYACCAILVLLMLLSVGARAIGVPTYFSDEYSGYLMATMIAMALSQVTGKDAHISADFFVERLSKRKIWPVLSIMHRLAFCCLASVILYLVVRLAYNSFVDSARSQGILQTPLFIPQTLMAIGLGVMVLRALGMLVQTICGQTAAARSTLKD